MSSIAEAAARRGGYAVDLLTSLVAEPSVEGSAAIDRCLDLIESEVATLAEVVRPEYDGVSNLIARFGDGPARIAFSGHVDVVAADGEWTTPPFELVRDVDALRGRGSCDMKGGVAAFVGAIRALADIGELERCRVELVLTGDEEVGSRRGLIRILEDGLVTAPAAICGEPTGLDVLIGNRGVIWLRITIRGQGGHAGLIHELANPVDPATTVVAALSELPLEFRDHRFDPPAPSLAVTKVVATAAAGAINVVPDSAMIAVDRRLLPGERSEEAIAQIRAAVEAVVPAPFAWQLEVVRDWRPYAISPAEQIAVVAGDAVRDAGRPATFGMDPASNDSSWLDQAGIKTVLLGPGDPGQAHAVNETLEARQLTDAVALYAEIAARLAGA